LVSPEENLLKVEGFLRQAQQELVQLKQIDSNPFSLERKPDVFLFIAESLRDDYLTKEVTPVLTQFREDYGWVQDAFSNANGTQLSWFSLFYSMYPFYWTQYQSKEWKKGSIPLSLLKKMGYEVYVYASSRLNYCSMDWVLFGERGNLLKGLYEFRIDEDLSSCETDAMAIQKLCEDIKKSEHKGGRVFITFLDSTHFDYSWPQDRVPRFTPIDSKINYWQVACQRDNLDPIKNRYKNALDYVDELFGTVQKTLKQYDMWDESVIVFTGDHGEEFNEHGCMFHASCLSSPQLKIPLYMKFGSEKPFLNEQKASQMDIFPTLFHYLLGEDLFAPYFQGESLLRQRQKDYIVGARYNASSPPYEFYIQNDLYRIIFEFAQHQDIFHCKTLKVKSIVDEAGQDVPFSPTWVQGQFGEALEHLFSWF
jgi:membrane-anchored protein YejM (alkaline phosphatase superfamily)